VNHCDRCRAQTQTHNYCSETYLGGGVLSALVFLLIAIACWSQL